ncbi:hypothetical protein CBS101457_004340 [Exobasidium rhododendri]|nr:hypothetical protein CBS101457_004340 [Exobasidium rhododendri]
MLFSTSAFASQGDRSPEYQNCVEACKLDSCFVKPDWDDGTAHFTKMPFILRVTGWNCLDDCRYHCTHRVTNEAHDRITKIREGTQELVEAEAQRNGWPKAEQRSKIDVLVNLRLASLRPVEKEMVQYYGKWVFIRFFGAQEPMSVLFSLLNFQVHFGALSLLRKQISDAYPLKLIYILHALLSCNAWLWSAIFHTRDKNFTEKMDYFSAGSVVLGGWFFAVCRLFRLGPDSRGFKLLIKGCGVAFTMHILYLSFGRFDYGYNMKVNLLFGISHSILWLLYSFQPQIYSKFSPKVERYNPNRLRNFPASPTMGSSTLLHSNGGSPPAPVSMPLSLPPSSSRKSKKQLQKIIILLVLASCLEVFDFPPFWRAVDAHSLWHLATIPLARMWYTWLIEDARECTATGFWVGEGLRFHKNETVENVSKVASDVVGTQVFHAYEKTIQVSKAAREWVELAAGKSSNALKDATGTSSGIEFKTLTNKLNEIARNSFGNSSATTKNDNSSDDSCTATSSTTTTTTTNGVQLRTSSISGTHDIGIPEHEREREKLGEISDRSHA